MWAATSRLTAVRRRGALLTSSCPKRRRLAQSIRDTCTPLWEVPAAVREELATDCMVERKEPPAKRLGSTDGQSVGSPGLTVTWKFMFITAVT
jgi:hypothetical protein